MKKVLWVVILSAGLASAEQVSAFGGLSTNIFSNWGGHVGLDVPLTQFPSGSIHARVAGEYAWSVNPKSSRIANTYAISADGIMKFSGDDMKEYMGLSLGYAQNIASVSGVFIGVLGGAEYALSDKISGYVEGHARKIFSSGDAFDLGIGVRFGVRFGL